MQILTPKKYELRLYEDIKNLDPKAFIISYEPKQIHGGFWVKQVRTGNLLGKIKKNQLDPHKKKTHKTEKTTKKIEEQLENEPKQDRKSTRLNSSHVAISYAVFCLKKKRT